MGLVNNTNITLLEVPIEYDDVYAELVNRIKTYGSDLVKDCAANKQPNNVNLMNCWSMFQAACFCYQTNELKKSYFLVNYIIAQLKLNIVPKIIDIPTDTPEEDIVVEIPKRITISSGDIVEEDNVYVDYISPTPAIQFVVEADWCKVIPYYSGNNHYRLVIEANANELSTTRKTNINIKFDGSTIKTVKLIQEANPNINWN